MTNPWDNDPIVQSSSASDAPWSSDPIVKAASTNESFFGTNRGVQGTNPSIEAVNNTTKTLVTAVPAAIANVAKTAYTLSGGTGTEEGPTPGMASNRGVNYPSSTDTGLGNTLTDINKTREDWMKGNAGAKAADIAGQAIVPVAGEEGVMAKAMSYLPDWMKVGMTGLAARSAVRAPVGAAQGAVIEAENPHDNQTRSQIASQEGEAMKTGAEFSTGIGGFGDVAKPIEEYRKYNFSGSKANVDTRAATEISNVTPDAGLQAAKDKVVNPSSIKGSFAEDAATPNDKGNLIVNPELGGAQREVQSGKNVPNEGFAQTANNGQKEVAPDTIFKAQNDKNKDVLSNEILSVVQSPNKDILANTPSSVEAGKTLTNEQKIAAEQSRLAYNEKYNSIDKDETLQGPVHDTTKQSFTDLSEGKTNGVQNLGLIHGENADQVLSDADNAFAGKQTIPVGKQIQMKNELRAHANDLTDYAYGGQVNPGSQEFKNTLAAAQISKQMADNIVDNLKRTTDVLTSSGEKVSHAVTTAETMKRAHEENFMENPDTFKGLSNKTNAPLQDFAKGGAVSGGQVSAKYGASESSTAKAMDKARQGKEAAPATVANTLIDSSNPAEFDSQIKNFKGREGLVGDKILADIKTEGGGDAVKTEKAFQKYYGPEQQASMQGQSPFIHDKLMKASGDAVVESIKAQTISKDIKTGYQKIDSAKLGELIDKHEDVLRQTLGNSGFNTLKEKQQTASVLDQVQELPAKTTSINQSKEIGALSKGITQKTLKLSYTAINAITKGLGDNVAAKVEAAKAQMLNDSEKAIPAIEAIRNGNKDPQGVVRAILNASAKAVPSIEAAVPNHSDKTLDKEIKSVYTPPKGGNVNDNSNNSPNSVAPNAGRAVPVESPLAPQSSNEGNDEKSLLSQFSPISDANASESIPGGKSSTAPFSANDAINAASQKTGIPVEYLKGLQRAETQGTDNPNTARPLTAAGKPASSALGAFQFVDKTWNDVASKHPDIPPITDQNRGTANDPRTDIRNSALAAGYYGSDSIKSLKSWMDREPTMADVHGAHVMGNTGFKQFLQAPPNSVAAGIVPAAAKNNHGLFYDANGKPLTVRKVYAKLEDKFLATNEPDTGPND